MLSRKKCAVIITTRNRPAELRDSLLSLANQTMDQGDYSVVVIDNLSGDGGCGTQAVCEDIKSFCPLLDLTYHREEVDGGVTYIRNKWAEKIDAEIIVFGDDDYIACDTLLSACYNTFLDPMVGIVVGPLLAKFEVSNPPWWVDKLWQKCDYGSYLSDYTLLDLGSAKVEIPYEFAFWSNYSVRKSVFLSSNGFGPDGFYGKKGLYNGNGEHHLNKFVKDSNNKIMYCPEMLAYHRIFPYRFESKYFRSRYYYYGISTSFSKTRDFGSPLGMLDIVKYVLLQILKISFKTGPLLVRISRFWQLYGFLSHQWALKNYPDLVDFVLADSWRAYKFDRLREISKGPSLW